MDTVPCKELEVVSAADAGVGVVCEYSERKRKRDGMEGV